MLAATHIKWDTDGDAELLQTLPKEIEIPMNVVRGGDEAISDYISDQTGFCHWGYEIANGS